MKRVHFSWGTITAIITLCATFAVSPAKAAKLDLTEVPAMHCFGTLRGVIENGDADTLRTVLDGQNIEYGKRLCLDSPGGSMLEGVKLAQLLIEKTKGTAIARGARCESACALAFMGGRRNDENDRGDHPDRKLHPLGKLGFHATALTVPRGQYDEASVTKAYNLASQGLSEILQLMPAHEFPRSLLVEMLATPSTDMLYVDTLSKAARWDVDIYPTVSPDQLTRLSMVHACDYGQMRFFDELDHYNETAPDSDPNIQTSLGEDGEIFRYSGSWEDGYRQELATGCEVSYFRHMPGWDDPLLRQTVYVSIGDASEDFTPYVLFPPNTPIQSLVRANDMKVEFRGSNSQQITLTFEGRCFVIKLNNGGGDLVDDEACEMERTLSVNQDLERRRLEVFTWPSGAKTVVKNNTEINGQSVMRYDSEPVQDWLAKRNFAGKDGMADYMGCWRNSKSGNLFCFANNASILNDAKLRDAWYKTRLN